MFVIFNVPAKPVWNWLSIANVSVVKQAMKVELEGVWGESTKKVIAEGMFTLATKEFISLGCLHVRY